MNKTLAICIAVAAAITVVVCFSIFYNKPVYAVDIEAIKATRKLEQTQALELWKSCDSTRELIMTSDDKGLSITTSCFEEGM